MSFSNACFISYYTPYEARPQPFSDVENATIVNLSVFWRILKLCRYLLQIQQTEPTSIDKMST